jgi:hypothetical protein
LQPIRPLLSGPPSNAQVLGVFLALRSTLYQSFSK